MLCPKCQHENPEGAKFCNECACKLDIICPKCENINPPGSKFCNECAYDLRKPKENAGIDYSKPQSYTPKYLADKILTTRSALEGERKIVTVLFADVANYTSMSEKLDPEEILQIMDGAFKIMMDETHKYEGTINQFTGDGIMAIFGAPVAHENHAQRACYTALSIQSAMADFSAKIEKKYGVDFKIRIGINSGAVIVSAIGDDLRMDYTAVGDTTNLAARMESLAKPGTIFVSSNTHKIVERYFEFNFIAKTEIKGKEEPQDIYELIKAGDVVTRIDASIAKGLTRFVGRKNSMAALMEIYDLVKCGSGQVVGIVGEAGVGKSRLILEFRNRIEEENHAFLAGQCLQYGGSILYKPILDILKCFFDIKDNDREFIIKKKIEDKILSIGSLIKTSPVIPTKAGHEVKHSAIQQKYGMRDQEQPGFRIRSGMTDENKTGFRISSGMTSGDKPGFRIRSGMTDEGKPGMTDDGISVLMGEGKHGLTQPVIPAKAGIQTDSVIAGFSLEQTIPAFQDLLSVKVDDEVFQKLEPKQKREKTFEAVRDLLISISQENPLIITVEDLHWIDDTSEQFLDYFIEWIANTPIMLILLYRTEYQHKWSSKTYYHKIGLDHLGKESAVELVKAMLEDGDVLPELRDLILSRAAGNPLFMEEFTHTLIENGTIKKQDNQYILSRKITEINVPDTVQGIIAARMDRLEENLKRTMQVASVIGRDFAFRILQTITGMQEELKSYLLNLQGLEFIYEKRLFPELEYIFKHALTQEVAYNSLLLKRRKQIHENIGKAIEKLYSERLEEFYEMLAYHYSRSDNLEKSVQYLKLSGQKTFQIFANEESFNFYNEALSILEKMPDIEQTKKQKIELILLMHNPMSLLGYPENSLEILQIGEELSKDLKDNTSLASFYGYISRCFSFKGRASEAIEFSESRFIEARKAQDMNMIAPLSWGLINAYQSKGYWHKILDLIPDIISLLEKTNQKNEFFGTVYNTYAYLITTLGLSLTSTGNLKKAMSFFEQGYDHAQKMNDIINMGLSEYYTALFYVIRGEGKKAIHHSQKAIKLFKEGGFLYDEAISHGVLGYGYFLTGDIVQSEKYIIKGYEMQKASPVIFNLPLYPFWLSLIHLDSGNLSKAQIYAEEALESAMKIGNSTLEAYSMISLGRIIGEKMESKRDDAENYILRGIKTAESIMQKPLYSLGYLYLGEFYADTGDYGKAIASLKKAESEYEDMEIDYWLSFTKSAIGMALAKEIPAQRDIAEDYIVQAIKIAKDHDFKPPLARGYLCLGDIYADHGQKEKALENLKKAEAMYQEMKMDLWLGKTREILKILI